MGRLWHSWRNGDAIAHLYALRKKEQYEAKGFRAFVHGGIFPSDGTWEVYVFPKKKNHGDYIT